MLDKKNISPKDLSKERLALLLKAAEQAFIDKGLDGCSIDHIARESGVSKSTIYRHYPNKTALFEAVCREITQEQARQLNSIALDEADPIRSLRVYAKHIHRIEITAPYREFVRLFISIAQRHPELAERIRREGVGHMINRLADFFTGLIAQGRMQHPDPNEAAITFYVLSRGHFRSLMRSESELHSAAEQHRLNYEIEIFFKGCALQ